VPNLLLAALIKQKVGEEAYNSLLQERKTKRKPEIFKSGKWTLFVDFLSPPSLSVLAVYNALGIVASSIAIVEQRTNWCDDVKKVEWEKEDPSKCLPRLEYRCAGEKPLVVTEPPVLISTMMELWGEGRLEPSSTVPVNDRVLFKQLVQQVWSRVVRPISRFVPRMLWLNSPPLSCPR
jgi:hypothetical protein